MDNQVIKEAINLAKEELIKREYARKSGHFTSKGDEYLEPVLVGRVCWVEFWDSRRLWVPTTKVKKDRKTLFKELGKWAYVSYTEVSEVQFINFCIAFEIDYEEILGTKETIIFEDEDNFVI